MSLAQTHYCQMKKYDAQDPRCAQVILNGYFTLVNILQTIHSFREIRNRLSTTHENISVSCTSS